MFKLHPARELGIVEESVGIDLLLAAWGVNKQQGDKDEGGRIRLQRQLNRELAYMIGLAINGKDIPEIEAEENSVDGDRFVESVPVEG